MASPSPGSRARGSAKDKQERRKTASAKRQMLALAEGMVQNAELPDDLSNRLSAPVTQLLRTGFVVDVSASAEEAPDLSAPTEHLETDVRTRMGIASADPDWQPKQLQQAWAPEEPAIANRLATLRAKLVGVAGSPDGPDLWA